MIITSDEIVDAVVESLALVRNIPGLTQDGELHSFIGFMAQVTGHHGTAEVKYELDGRVISVGTPRQKCPHIPAVFYDPPLDDPGLAAPLLQSIGDGKQMLPFSGPRMVPDLAVIWPWWGVDLDWDWGNTHDCFYMQYPAGLMSEIVSALLELARRLAAYRIEMQFVIRDLKFQLPEGINSLVTHLGPPNYRWWQTYMLDKMVMPEAQQ